MVDNHLSVAQQYYFLPSLDSCNVGIGVKVDFDVRGMHTSCLPVSIEDFDTN